MGFQVSVAFGMLSSQRGLLRTQSSARVDGYVANQWQTEASSKSSPLILDQLAKPMGTVASTLIHVRSVKFITFGS